MPASTTAAPTSWRRARLARRPRARVRGDACAVALRRAFELQPLTLVKLLAVGLAAGTVAAVAPARRAARLDVLAALQYE